MDPKELIGQAQLLFVEGKINESIELFKKALDEGGDPFMINLTLGAAKMKLNDYENAIEYLNKTIEINNKNPRPYYYRGLAHLHKKEYDKALADFTYAIELKPDFYQAKFARATSYAKLKMFNEAADDLKSIMPALQSNVQGLVDTYGIIRTELWDVISQLSGEAQKSIGLTDQELQSIKNLLEE